MTFAPNGTHLFYKLGVLKVQDVFKLQVSKFIFNCLQLNTPTIFHNWFRLNYTVHNYNTRSTIFDIDNAINSNNLLIINYRLKLVQSIWPQNMEPHSKSYKKHSICVFF